MAGFIEGLAPEQHVRRDIHREVGCSGSVISSPEIRRELRKENRTGLPDNLKSGIEYLSGLRPDDVKVHYNSARPAQLQALAYAQGTDIHFGHGHQHHLSHEAWHVVQQRSGRP